MEDQEQLDEDASQQGPDGTEESETRNTYIAVLWEPISNNGETVMSWAPPHILERQLRETVTTPKAENTIDVWLQSIGGSADEAYRYVLLFREYAAQVRVIVGAHAKSAATLMLLGADSIYMGPTSELGPLDAQVWVDEEDRRISALDIARSVEHLAKMALDLALSSGGVVHGITGIPRRQVLPALLNFSAEFVQPIVSKLDPSAIHRASNQLDVARQYGERLLKMRAEPMEDQEASKLTYHLINDYPDHNFIISRDEAVEIGLPVKPLAEYELVEAFEALTETFEEDDSLNVTAFKLPDLDEVDEADAERETKGPDGSAVEGGEAISSPAGGAHLVAMPDTEEEGDGDDDEQDQQREDARA